MMLTDTQASHLGTLWATENNQSFEHKMNLKLVHRSNRGIQGFISQKYSRGRDLSATYYNNAIVANVREQEELPYPRMQ